MLWWVWMTLIGKVSLMFLREWIGIGGFCVQVCRQLLWFLLILVWSLYMLLWIYFRPLLHGKGFTNRRGPRKNQKTREKAWKKLEKSFPKRNSGLTPTKNHPFFVRGSRLHSPLILGVSFEMMQACTGFHGFVGCGSSPCSFRRIWPWGWLLLAEGTLHPQRAQTKKISLIYSLEV